MSLKRSTPGERGETPRVERFSYTSPAIGLAKSWTAWAAADPYWCRVHEHTKSNPGTKPCMTWLTDGAVPCARCRPGMEATDVCYCHLYREVDRAPVLVICHDSVADLLCDVRFGTHVLVGRIEGQTSAFVKPTDSALPWASTQPHRQNAIDTAVSLLGLWNVPALNEWYAGTRRNESRGTNDVPAPVPGKPVVGFKRFVELGSVGSMEGSVTNPAQHRNEQFVQDARKPGTNGKHKPTG